VVKQYKDLDIEHLSLDDDDWLTAQTKAGITGKIKKKNLVAGLATATSNANPILSNPSLVAYWDAENVSVNNGKITAFTDRSNNSKTASQATTNLQASLISNVINSKPVARFAGGQYYTHVANNDPLTVIAVVRNTSVAAHRTLLGAANANSGSGTGSYYFKTSDPIPRMSFVRGGLSTTVVDASPISSERFYVQSSRNKGTSLELFFNNLLINSVATSGTALAISNPLFGAGYFNGAIVDYFAGDAHTIAMFNAVLSDSLLIQYINYLRDYLKL
jgi:hypothetical protein